MSAPLDLSGSYHDDQRMIYLLSLAARRMDRTYDRVWIYTVLSRLLIAQPR